MDKDLKDKLDQNFEDSLEVFKRVIANGGPDNNDDQELKALFAQRDVLSHEAFKNAK